MEKINSINWIEIITAIAEILLASVAIVISIIAIMQTKKQIQLSNKQVLFSRRLRIYTIIAELFACCDVTLNRLNGLDSSDEIDHEFIKKFVIKILETISNSPVLQGMIDKKSINDFIANTDNNFDNRVFILLSELRIETSVTFDNTESISELFTSFINNLYGLLFFGSRYLIFSNLQKQSDHSLQVIENILKPVLQNQYNEFEGESEDDTSLYSRFINDNKDTIESTDDDSVKEMYEFCNEIIKGKETREIIKKDKNNAYEAFVEYYFYAKRIYEEIESTDAFKELKKQLVLK